MSDRMAGVARLDQAYSKLIGNVQEATAIMLDGLDHGVSPEDSVSAFYEGTYRGLNRRTATVLFGVALLELAKRDRADGCAVEGACCCACHR